MEANTSYPHSRMNLNKERIFRDWCHVPIVIITLCCIIWGVDMLLKHIPPLKSFPASVASMILLFAILLILDCIDSRRTSKLVSLLEPGTGFVLGWINIFLMPSFLNLPTINRPTAKEVGEIAVVFVICYLFFVSTSSLLVRAFRAASPFKYLSSKRDEDIEQVTQDVNSEFQLEADRNYSQVQGIESSHIPRESDEVTVRVDDAEQMTLHTNRKTQLATDRHANQVQDVESSHISRKSDEYTVRADSVEQIAQHTSSEIQLDMDSNTDQVEEIELFPMPLKGDEDIAIADNAEQVTQHVSCKVQLEMDGNASQVQEREINHLPTKTIKADSFRVGTISEPQVDHLLSPSIEASNENLEVADRPSETTDDISESLSSTRGVLEQPLSTSKWQRTRAYIGQKLSFAHIVYGTVFIVSFIIYLAIPKSSPIYLPILLPLYLCMSVLAYYLALQVPERIRFFLHPIISSSAILWLGIEIIEAIKGGNLLTGLAKFSTGITFLDILEGNSQGRIPGAGDILFSLLDCSIISLAIVMFRYRMELKKHAFEMVLTLLCASMASLFCLPLFAHSLGVPPANSLSLAPRSVTTPLAMVVANILEADSNATVCFVILTGILGTIIGPYLLKLLRVKEDDYVTIGVAMGSNSHAIATASLLRTNPRAAAIASLSFVIFGTTFVIVVSIPIVPQTLRQLVGFH